MTKVFGDVMDRNYHVITFNSEYISLKKAWSIFVDIIKIVTIFIKTIFKDSKKLKELEIIHIFLDITKLVDIR